MVTLNEMLAHAEARHIELPDPSERRALRKRAGLLQEELAAVVGVDRTSVVGWERGEHEPSGARRQRYAQALSELARRFPA